ncbi:MAG TPA: hypothetical protein VK456_09300 [Xanthobacteraceae bacterium]|nr:hypothetical protein [Xanthobacteraceae bacterium]
MVMIVVMLLVLVGAFGLMAALVYFSETVIASPEGPIDNVDMEQADASVEG